VEPTGMTIIEHYPTVEAAETQAAFLVERGVGATVETDPGSGQPVLAVLDDLLRLPAKGLTNVGVGLTVALDELAAARARRRQVILLSDAGHNAGPDPRLIAARAPRLDVLLQTDGEHDRDLAADLARLGRGHMLAVRDHRDVAPALNRVLRR